MNVDRFNSLAQSISVDIFLRCLCLYDLSIEIYFHVYRMLKISSACEQRKLLCLNFNIVDVFTRHIDGL